MFMDQHDQAEELGILGNYLVLFRVPSKSSWVRFILFRLIIEILYSEKWHYERIIGTLIFHSQYTHVFLL